MEGGGNDKTEGEILLSHDTFLRILNYFYHEDVLLL